MKWVNRRLKIAIDYMYSRSALSSEYIRPAGSGGSSMLCCSLPCERREWRVLRHNWTSLIAFWLRKGHSAGKPEWLTGGVALPQPKSGRMQNFLFKIGQKKLFFANKDPKINFDHWMILQKHVLSFKCNDVFKIANLKAISSSATLSSQGAAFDLRGFSPLFRLRACTNPPESVPEWSSGANKRVQQMRGAP